MIESERKRPHIEPAASLESKISEARKEEQGDKKVLDSDLRAKLAKYEVKKN